MPTYCREIAIGKIVCAARQFLADYVDPQFGEFHLDYCTDSEVDSFDIITSDGTGVGWVSADILVLTWEYGRYVSTPPSSWEDEQLVWEGSWVGYQDYWDSVRSEQN